ncbi:MAG TPA: SDR family oxidoreductase [Pyrinomonadaceae bacterium]|nr:SDR family oxidoreductase [Pyrinomonadaceae bacterium]
MKVLIFGGKGMLGHKLVQRLSGEFDVWATVRGASIDYSQFGFLPAERTIGTVDAAHPAEIHKVLEMVAPDVVINAIGIIKQLPSSKDVIRTLEINSIFPNRLAELTHEFGYRLITISTDCVFSGDRGMYTEESVPDAGDLYGKSKNLGEVTGERCLTLRTSIIGRELGCYHSLVDWFLSNQGNTVRGFVNAIYSGFPTIVFTDIIASLITEHPELHGLYHVSSEPINKFDLLHLIKKYFHAHIEIERFEEFRIDRSLDSSRFRRETGFRPISWEHMVERMAADPTPYEKWRT